MTRNRQFSLLMACALLAGTGHASRPESQSAASRGSDAPRNVRQTRQVVNDKKKPQPYTKTGAKPHNPQVTSKQGQSTQRPIPSPPKNAPSPAVSEYSASPSQPVLSHGVGVAKSALLQTPPVGDALPTRPPSVGASGAVPQNDVRHHGPNPSAIGGAASSKATNMASISGSTVRHRP